MPAELRQRDARLHLRFDEECPPGITKYASIRKATAFLFVPWLELARYLLFGYSKLTKSGDVMSPGPAEERS
jgi:hypothetical protein